MSENCNNRLLVTSDGVPRERICGIETEYGLNYIAPDPEKNPLTKWGHESVAYYAKFVGQEYRPEGDRIYLDVNNHPEYATAEEDSFIGAAYRVLAGHVEMARRYSEAARVAASRSELELDPKRVGLTANTCSPNGASWASHENLLARRALEPKDYITALATHHASRIVWSGAGSVAKADIKSDDYRFVLSEKAGHIRAIYNDDTTKNRALVNSRDEPLADYATYRRIHIIAGESNMSPSAIALRLASGSIVLRACELGIKFDDLMLAGPPTAMQRISSDPTLKDKVELVDGRQLTGLELQRAIAERSIEATEKADYITPQERHWAVEWQRLLDDLESDPNSCAQRVDWVVKQKLIDRELRAPRKIPQSLVSIAWAKSVDYHRLMPIEGAGMLMLRKGFFEASPSAMELENGLPLPNTRAKLRGETIRVLYEQGVDYKADWETIALRKFGRSLKFNDPYAIHDSRTDAFLAPSLMQSKL